MHDHIVFKLIDTTSLIPDERKKAMESLMFLTEKRDGHMKDKTCTNSSTHQSRMPKDEASVPMSAADSALLTAAAEAKEECNAALFPFLRARKPFFN